MANGFGFYRFRPTLQPTAGANLFAFLPKFGLPMQALEGAGIVPWSGFTVTGPEQVYFTHDTIADGLQGVVAGQIVGQPLLDPRFM